MDFTVREEDFEVLVERQKERVKNQILTSYINLRKERGITQQEIADRTGIKRTNVARIESGRNAPTIEVLVKLAAALDMELEIRLVER
ncbi:XRE family transcriptional regulator [Roseburia inulinivorans]|uniref:XRE family transcriptional regulator n=1 Tax=Roseburia inulinivorans TaxID=360807 RepID=A0A3R6H0D5_9FIRM|nr:helix-turn-helix transcriptional regulator [Roseburia inulinivorans]RHF83269.1 XRE family transcriptional regulator [Roseburia inulinivorans]